MQHATFNRLFNKHVLGLKTLCLAFFLAVVLLPLHKAHAANFTCVNKVITSDSVVLTVAETTDARKLADVGFIVMQDESTTPKLTTPDKVSAGANAKQQIYEFDNLRAGARYALVARLNSDNSVEVIPDCSFTTKEASDTSTTVVTPKTATPAVAQSTVTTPAASAGASQAVTGNKGMGLIPCDGGAADPCDLNSVMQLANTLLAFFFKTLLLPLFVVMVVYLGYSYIAAQGKSGQHAKLGSMAKHMVLGVLLMLCAWVIVKTLIFALGYSDDLFFFSK